MSCAYFLANAFLLLSTLVSRARHSSSRFYSLCPHLPPAQNHSKGRAIGYMCVQGGRGHWAVYYTERVPKAF